MPRNLILLFVGFLIGLILIVKRQSNKQPLTNNIDMNKTFAIIKPNAVQDKNSGKIIDLIEANDFEIIDMKKITISDAQAKKFYDIHKERPFFGELVEMMTSGPVIIMVLQKDNAMQSWRDLMGATNPADAAEGTMRKKFGKSIGENATHGSDSPENAQIEIAQFFPELI